MNRINVVGGGLAGLTAAAVALTEGAEVTVFEARRTAGGRARTSPHHGFRLNQGPHALYLGGAGMRILASLGISPRGGQPEVGRGWGRFADGRMGLLPVTPSTLLRTGLLDRRAKVEAARMFASPRRLLVPDAAGLSASDWIDQVAVRPLTRQFLAAMVRLATYTSDLDHLSADAAATQVVLARDGVLYLDDGWQQLVDALAGIVTARGGRIERSERISDLGALPDADATILAVGGPHQVAELLGHRSTVVAGWAERERPVRAASLDLALTSLPRPDRRFVLGIDEPLYLSAHTPAARLAPAEGGEVLHVLWYGSEMVDDPRSLLEARLDELQPGWRDRVVEARFGHHLVVAHGRPMPGSGLEGRPGPAVPDLEGVFVAGDWVGPVGLLGDAAISSGAAAARAASTAAAPRHGTRA